MTLIIDSSFVSEIQGHTHSYTNTGKFSLVLNSISDAWRELRWASIKYVIQQWRRMTHALAGLPSSHTSIVAAVEVRDYYPSSRWVWSASVIDFFECTEYIADRNSSNCTRIRRISSSNPGDNQTDWGSFRGFPQSSKQMLCWINITTIHKIYKSQILRQ